MRWHRPVDGQTRIKRRFLLLPKEIKLEVRWFEIARWEEMYSADLACGGWYKTRWIDYKEGAYVGR